jgi:glycosyltransferase involved in cell wall biosynthesis
MAISEHLRTWLIEAGFAPDLVTVKYNGVARPTQRVLPEPSASTTFLFAAKLAEYKGVSLLLDAWQQLGDLDAELRIVGDGPLADQVKAAAAADPRITWLGQVPAADIPGHIAAARAVVVPSTWAEPFGRTAAEAMALGRPVLTTGMGGLREVVTDTTGWITGNDPSAFARALTEAATSDDAVSKRSRAATERYERLFSPETTTRTLLRVYEDALREIR